MEAAAAAASAAAAAAKEEALATSVAAAAAAKDAAAAATTAKEARAAAKEAAAAASAAEVNAREADVKAYAAELNAKEAAAVAATLEQAAAAATAALQASKKRKFHLLVDDGQDPPGSEDVGDGESVDFISRLPDAVLGSIVSLLPTKEGARTQAVSRRWRPLWRSAPLNLLAGFEYENKGLRIVDLVTRILSQHPGPARRFSLYVNFGDYYDYHDKVGGWLSSQALDNLQELVLTYNQYYKERPLYLLPSSAYRFAPTLRVANFSGCHLPDLIVQLSLKFPCLKQLTLDGVTTSEDALQSILSGCPALESLHLMEVFGFGRLCVSSRTLKSIGFGTRRKEESVRLQELVIVDTPCLERLLPDPQFGSPTIRVISAPKLKILGVLSEGIAELQFGNTVFQKMIAVSLTTKMHTVKSLVLDSSGPNLDIVANFIKCFPCLERLYVTVEPISLPWMVMNNVQKYDPLDPIECFELHLKEVVLMNYDGTKSPSIDFAKFFILNAKVLKEMKITLPYHRQQKWFDNQHRVLQIKHRASQDARIQLKCATKDYLTHNWHTHDLSMADPFVMPSSGCYKCSRCPF